MIDITENGVAPDINTACALGLFDGVHLGHKMVIERAVCQKLRGLSPAVFTFRTDTVTSKGHDGRVEMILDDREKQRHFAALGVELLYSPTFESLREMSPEEFVKDILVGKLHCKSAVCGSDFRFGKGAIGTSETLKELGAKYGIQVEVCGKLRIGGQEVSSTLIRDCIRTGRIAHANRLLGYPFSLELTVEHGRELGRTWDFPTINQCIPLGQILPKFGVYRSTVLLEGERYKGVTNVGVKPTVGCAASPLAETYILDFSGDLYGATIRVELEEFIRAERKFQSVDELKEQIDRDVQLVARGKES